MVGRGVERLEPAAGYVLGWGRAPALHFPPPHPFWIPAPYRGTGHAFDRRNDEGMPRMANERLPERSIPDRSPGHAFIAIAHAGWRRHTKV